MRKIILITLIPLIAEVLIACCRCVEPIMMYYTHTKILLENLDNSGQAVSVTSSNTVIKTAYGIRVKLSREKTACLHKVPSLFISTAYAFKCDCPPNEDILRDSITTIKVFTLQDFNNNHLSNADVSEYFKVYKPYSFLTIEEYLKTSNNEKLLYGENILEANIDMLLMTPPTLNLQHRFKVQIIFSNGKTLEQETTAIDLI